MNFPRDHDFGVRTMRVGRKTPPASCLGVKDEEHDMDVKATLKPGQKGTKALTEEFGERLVCVRYRYDAGRRKRYKTVELIVETRDWVPPVPGPYDYVLVHIPFRETATREKVKLHGGRWDRERKAWRLLWGSVTELGLEHRVVAMK